MSSDDDEVWDSADESDVTDEGELSDSELLARFQTGELRGQKGAARRSAGTRTRGSLDADGLAARHKDIAIAAGLPWVETNIVGSALPAVSASDDFARENAFYDHTLAGVQEAFALFKKHGVPVRRPSDYYAEMLKTDEHMARIKERLIVENKKIEASERARKQRENKRFGKKVQQEVLAKRQAAKKAAIGEATKLRKGLKQKIANASVDFGVEAVSDGDGDKQQRRGGRNKKRAAKDAKFGFGGKQNNSRAKRNDADSFMEGRFNVAKNKSLPRGFAGKAGAGKAGGKGKKKKASRPGKSKRKAGGK